jgi:hypothetical protein
MKKLIALTLFLAFAVGGAVLVPAGAHADANTNFTNPNAGGGANG